MDILHTIRSRLFTWKRCVVMVILVCIISLSHPSTYHIGEPLSNDSRYLVKKKTKFSSNSSPSKHDQNTTKEAAEQPNLFGSSASYHGNKSSVVMLQKDDHVKPIKATKLLLVTYHRSGSTFLGEMVNNNPEAFYMFEPLFLPFNKWIYHNSRTKKSKYIDTLYVYKNGSLVNLPDKIVNDLVDPIKNILNCRFDKIPNAILSHRFHTRMDYSNSLIPYRKCYKSTGGNMLNRCKPVLHNQCQSKKIRATKVIRLSGGLVKTLLTRDPSIKIVHYIRDPRGILSSKSKARPLVYRLRDQQKIFNASRSLCNRIKHDIKAMGTLQKHQTDILHLKYEDLALDPSDGVRRLYNFIGHPVPGRVAAWIKKNTQAARADGTMGTQRNSKKVALQWRGRLPVQAHRIILENCRYVLQHFDYPINLG